MVEQLKSWLSQNTTLVTFLAAQLAAMGAAGSAFIAYSVRLETRVSIMETRGAEYTVDRMNRIDQRITVLEQAVKKNEADLVTHQARIERIVSEFLKDRK